MTNFSFPLLRHVPRRRGRHDPTLHLCADRRHAHAAPRPAVASIPTLPNIGNGPTLNALSSDPGVLSPGTGPMKPEQKGRFFAHWWPEAGRDNDFLMDLEAKRTRNATGIPSVRLQDAAVISSMGETMDRTREHLGTADATIIKARRMLIGAALALRDHGVTRPASSLPRPTASVPSRPPCGGRRLGRGAGGLALRADCRAPWRRRPTRRHGARVAVRGNGWSGVSLGHGLAAVGFPCQARE